MSVLNERRMTQSESQQSPNNFLTTTVTQLHVRLNSGIATIHSIHHRSKPKSSRDVAMQAWAGGA